MDAAAAGAIFGVVTTMLIAPVKAGPYPAGFAAIQRPASSGFTQALAEPGPLPIIEIATASSPGDAVYRQTSTSAAWGLLGVAFSILAALDLAFLRHVKRAYAPAVCRRRRTR